MEASKNDKPRKSYGLRIFFGIILVLSILFNIFLLLGMIGVASLAFEPQEDGFAEYTIKEGDEDNKIVVIGLEGVIDIEMAKEVIEQIEAAQKDSDVEGLIIRTISPGGSVVASDEIHHAIRKYCEETEKPVVAFMQGLAASGGYYTSVACDKIIAEPTTITGSIGVIMRTFMLEELFAKKLGVEAVTIKSGKKKDWPTAFSEVTDEQREYLMEKLINPAYERFVKLIDEGRESLELEQIKILGDGSIYHATEAMENGLIDEIGYIDEAIELVAKLADISNPHVVEYTETFSLKNLLGAEGKAENLLNISKKTIREATTPELLYLWDGTN